MKYIRKLKNLQRICIAHLVYWWEVWVSFFMFCSIQGHVQECDSKEEEGRTAGRAEVEGIVVLGAARLQAGQLPANQGPTTCVRISVKTLLNQ